MNHITIVYCTLGIILISSMSKTTASLSKIQPEGSQPQHEIDQRRWAPDKSKSGVNTERQQRSEGIKREADLDKKDIVDFVQAVMKCKHVPGLTMALISKDSSWTEGFGVRDLTTGDPVSSSTLFGIGSITKTFTAALLALALDEVNRGGMNASWSSLVKDVIKGELELATHLEDEVTLEDVLAHRTGLMAADIMAVAGFPATFSRQHFIRQLRYLPSVMASKTMWYYNNWVYSLASDVTEYLLEDDWKTLLKRRLLAPLGMRDDLIVWDDVNVTSSKMARPYQRMEGELYEVDESLYDLRQGKQSGALAVSAEDMIKYMSFLLQDGVLPSGRRLLSEKRMKEMTSTHVHFGQGSSGLPVEDVLEGYGLGWYIGTYRGKRRVMHTGGWFGFLSVLVWFPDDHAAVFVSTSGPGTSAGTDAYRAISYFLSDIALGYTPWLDQATACESKDKDDEGDDKNDETEKAELGKIENVQKYIGKYSNPLFGDIVIQNSTSHYGMTLQFQRLEGFLIPQDKDFEFKVQYTGKTAFYSVDEFEVRTSSLYFGRSLTEDGHCPSLVLRAPPPQHHERLDFMRK